ncbi:5NTD-like protein [Mya arenaria]|uniref:5'-nucleotidase n=1 Tax=Mya arenaria TaxID=6604 RepID=A0ABY7E9T9_MYAAR|nr:5NTD-like protein [Mya arenaria]
MEQLPVNAYSRGSPLDVVTIDENGVRWSDYLLNKRCCFLRKFENETFPDAAMLRELPTWREPVNALQTRAIGSTKTLLDGQRDHCRYLLPLQIINTVPVPRDSFIEGHCSVPAPRGSLIEGHCSVPVPRGHCSVPVPRDSFIEGHCSVPVPRDSFIEGHCSVPVPRGVLTAGDANAIFPFRNEVDLVRVRGIHFSGVRVRYNVNKPVGQRVVSVDVRCRDCDVPTYSPLENDTIYSVLMTNFVIEGGDGFSFQPIERVLYSILDVDHLTVYIENHSPVWAEE